MIDRGLYIRMVNNMICSICKKKTILLIEDPDGDTRCVECFNEAMNSMENEMDLWKNRERDISKLIQEL